ncbi:hypothetical protein [Companilactobacillus furfuricola]|uniref:hypothetical protein n=1 Tax=Companilactobacillus furfuricola TaxID=1462575 RepID=UPI000F798DAD|nr:hypothetical protein [Companilactobacillus furfuricola]
MKKTIVTLLAAVTLMGTATVTTACSNTKTEQTETHSAKKVTRDEIVGHDYVGVSKNNKDQYITFFTGKNGKNVKHFRVSKDGSQKTITYFMKKPELKINKKNPKKFTIKGYSVIAEPDFQFNFTKSGKTTIKSEDNQKWKLFDGTHKEAIKHAQNQAKSADSNK